MEILTSLTNPLVIIAICAVPMLAGFVKGVVGFGMPMLLLSGLSSLIAPEMALAALIIPTLVSNGWQALHLGPSAALEVVLKFKLFMIIGGIALVSAAQLVPIVDKTILLLILGIFVTIFAALQLTGWQPKLRPSTRVEAGFGLIAGTAGGFTGVWGPPTVMYLTLLNTAKKDQVVIQGVIYGMGAVALTFAHINSGLLTWNTGVFSAVLLVPAMIGLVLGIRLQNVIDQAMFKRVTNIALLFGGLNLLRLALTG